MKLYYIEILRKLLFMKIGFVNLNDFLVII